MTFEVIQGHFEWCCLTVGISFLLVFHGLCLNLVPFPRYYYLFVN